MRLVARLGERNHVRRSELRFRDLAGKAEAVNPALNRLIRRATSLTANWMLIRGGNSGRQSAYSAKAAESLLTACTATSLQS
jgi:hypothetical protein